MVSVGNHKINLTFARENRLQKSITHFLAFGAVFLQNIGPSKEAFKNSLEKHHQNPFAKPGGRYAYTYDQWIAIVYLNIGKKVAAKQNFVD